MKNKTKTIILVVILILAVLPIVFLSNYAKKGIASEYDQLKTKIVQQENNGEEKSANPEGENEKITSAGAGGGGGSAGQTSQESFFEDCERTQISYSMISPNKTQTCGLYDGEVCTEKTIVCSIEVKNRDEETSGTFTIELLFVEETLPKESAFNSESIDIFLSPGESRVIHGSTTVQSTGSDGLANKNINCFYTTLEIPEKGECIEETESVEG